MARIAAEGTRDRILRAAGELFYLRGVRVVSMSQIIDEAGCGKNLLYSHFASKDDLVAAYLSAEVELREQQAEQALAAAGNDGVEQLVALTAFIAGCVGDDGFRGCAMRNFAAECPDDDSAAIQVAHAYLDDARARIDRLVRKTGLTRPGEIAERIWLIHDGLYAMAARPWVRSKPAVAVRLVRDILTA